MIGKRKPGSWFLVALLGVVVISCDNPVEPRAPELELTVHLGSHDFFEGEPLYVVFELANKGQDTAWITPFGLPAWFLHADLVGTDGWKSPEWGVIVDYLFPPGYRGAPLAPGKRVFDIALLQYRWGDYESAAENLYLSHHVPTGTFTFSAHFVWELRGSRFRGPRSVDATPVTFTVRSRTPQEDTAFSQVEALAAMPWDTLQRPDFLSTLIRDVEGRDPSDVFVPLLSGQLVGTAWAVGYPPDSADEDRLTTVRVAAAEAQRFMPGGAMAVASIDRAGSTLMRDLADRLNGSLAGAVATWLVERRGGTP